MTHKSHKPVTALMAGSFNPFTIGHKDIADRALKLFDRLIIAVGVNISKGECPEDAASRVASIANLYEKTDRVMVMSYTGLTADLCAETGAQVLVRGVRSMADYSYEQTMADANRNISGIETVLLTARPELAFVSSSMVRELRAFGHDVSPYLPTQPSRHTSTDKR